MRAPIDFSAFPREREKKLKSIYRYSMFDVMLYRSNLWMHSHRVHWLVDEMTPLAKRTLSGFDADKARVLALVHDDAEMIIGDYQAGHKAKMTPRQLRKIERDEVRAARVLASKSPRMVGGYSYEKLLLHAIRKDCVEAQFVSYIDRLDAYCETLHELLAGNISFLWSLMLYDRWTASYAAKYPALRPMMRDTRSPFILGDNRYQPKLVRAKDHIRFSKPHTAQSIRKTTGFSYYDAWKEMVLRRGGEEGRRWLITQREFLPARK